MIDLKQTSNLQYKTSMVFHIKIYSKIGMSH